MPTQTPVRRSTTAYRERPVTGSYDRYNGYGQGRQSTARVYDFPITYPDRIPVQPRKKETVQEASKQKRKGIQVHRGNLLKTFMRIFLVVGLCMLMLYRYATILEYSNQIDDLQTQISAISAKNQSLQTKLDRGLELSVLEEYATGQLGMIRPDNSQMFYIDMQLSDVAKGEASVISSEAKSALQGAPGALVHALRVLK
ncbi:MAG: hypothetical protein IKW60_03215 [Clostridia bacterium]|nr:hypothetical protein [Clostridia bacterium]